MMLIAIGLYPLSSFSLLFLDFKKMDAVFHIFLAIQFIALWVMVISWLGIRFLPSKCFREPVQQFLKVPVKGLGEPVSSQRKVV